jgi:hypothetical protein
MAEHGRGQAEHTLSNVHEAGPVITRYGRRLSATGSANLTGDQTSDTGRVLDLSLPGCLPENPHDSGAVTYVRLRYFLPDRASPMTIPLAVVRWVKGVLPRWNLSGPRTMAGYDWQSSFKIACLHGTFCRHDAAVETVEHICSPVGTQSDPFVFPR